MSDEERGSPEPEEGYEAPQVEDLDLIEGSSTTAAGATFG